MRALHSPIITGLFVAIFSGATLMGVFVLINRYVLTSTQAAPATVTCYATGAHHTVDITDGKLSTAHTTGKLCDTLTITNNDQRLRLIAFGPHEDHQPYDGITEEVLAQGQSLTVTFNQVGTFSFHDHIDDAVRGDFTVTR